MRTAFDPAVLGHPLPARPTRPQPRFASRQEFLVAEVAAQYDAPRLRLTDHGFIRQHPEGPRPYVALRCHCPHAACAGWIMVHDHPDDIAYFNKLFGDPQGRLGL